MKDFEFPGRVRAVAPVVPWDSRVDGIAGRREQHGPVPNHKCDKMGNQRHDRCDARVYLRLPLRNIYITITFELGVVTRDSSSVALSNWVKLHWLYAGAKHTCTHSFYPVGQHLVYFDIEVSFTDSKTVFLDYHCASAFSWMACFSTAT